jgi:hypothetical protein
MKGLPSIRAFVVQFRDAHEVDGERSGRVEHVASGRTATFTSLEELSRVLLALLKSLPPDEEGGNR